MDLDILIDNSYHSGNPIEIQASTLEAVFRRGPAVAPRTTPRCILKTSHLLSIAIAIIALAMALAGYPKLALLLIKLIVVVLLGKQSNGGQD